MHPEACKAIHPTVGQMTSKQKSGEARHEHGSVSCVVAFLGEENWSHRKVGDLLIGPTRDSGGILAREVRMVPKKYQRRKIARWYLPKMFS